MKEEKSAQHCGRDFFPKSTQTWKFSLCFARMVGRPLPFVGPLLEGIELI